MDVEAVAESDSDPRVRQTQRASRAVRGTRSMRVPGTAEPPAADSTRPPVTVADKATTTHVLSPELLMDNLRKQEVRIKATRAAYQKRLAEGKAELLLAQKASTLGVAAVEEKERETPQVPSLQFLHESSLKQQPAIAWNKAMQGGTCIDSYVDPQQVDLVAVSGPDTAECTLPSFQYVLESELRGRIDRLAIEIRDFEISEGLVRKT